MRRSSIATFVAVLALAAPAGAQDLEGARRAFREGLGAFDEGDHEAALRAFQRSFELRPVPSVLFNIARTYEGLRRYPEAIRTYERYLREEVSVPPARRRLVRDEMERLTRLIAPLEVTVSPPGARIRIDGEEVEAGSIPLAPGEHLLEVSAPGHATERREIAAEAGRRLELQIELMPAEDPARLAVTSTPPGATVEIDGESQGVSPWSGPVAPGPHRLRLVLDGYSVGEREVVLTAGQDRSLQVELSRAENLAESPVLWGLVGAAVAIGVGVGVFFALYEPPQGLAGNFDPPIVMALSGTF